MGVVPRLSQQNSNSSMPAQKTGSQDGEKDQTRHQEEEQYRCTFCGDTYPHEALTRAHVTRSEGRHLNYKGDMPEVDIEVLDRDGDVIETRSTTPEQFDPYDVDVDDLSDDLKDSHKRIILIAAVNPNIDSYEELKEKVNDVFEQRGEDTVSYATVRRVVKDYFEPEESAPEGVDDMDREVLSDLTAKQQATIITELVTDGLKHEEIAGIVGTSQSYPSQVFNRAEEVLEGLEEKIESGMTTREAILDELTPEDLITLEGQGFVEDLDFDLPTPGSDDESSTPEDGSASETTAEADSSEAESEAPSDGPVSQQAKPMTASPSTPWDEQPTQPPTEELQPADGTPSDQKAVSADSETDSDGADASEGADASSNDESSGAATEDESAPETTESTTESVTGTEHGESAVPREDVEEVLEKVRFHKRAVEKGVEIDDSEASTSRDLAFAEVVEEELEQLLT